jgi:four helix bundle protein
MDPAAPGPVAVDPSAVEDAAVRAISNQQSAISRVCRGGACVRSREDMKDFRDLLVWQRSHQLTLDVYQATKVFPKEERYGMTSQLRRAASSVSANLAEGCGRSAGGGDFGRFVQIAMGSASELEYFLLLARDLGLLIPDDYARLGPEVVEVKKMLAGLISKLKSDRLRSASESG